MDRPEAVAQQVLGVQSLDIFKLFWQMPLWRIIAENVLDCEPYLARAEKDTTL
jgi:hypothetical protein